MNFTISTIAKSLAGYLAPSFPGVTFYEDPNQQDSKPPMMFLQQRYAHIEPRRNNGYYLRRIGLDLTYQARADKSVRDAFKAIGTPAGDFMYQTLETFAENYKAWRGFDAPPLHDPCAMAYVIDPTVMEVVPVPINVETKGALTAGMTVCDFRRRAPEGCHTFAALKLNVPQFWEMLISSVKAIG